MMANKLIEDLSKQAHAFAWSTHDKDLLNWPTLFTEKFAELIVLKCAKVVNDNDFAGSTIGDNLLKSHFGIK